MKTPVFLTLIGMLAVGMASSRRRILALVPPSISRIRRSFSMDALFLSIKTGDDVLVKVDGSHVVGTVSETRGAGWYTVRVGDDTRKLRSSQLVPLSDLPVADMGSDTGEAKEEHSVDSPELLFSAPPPPTIIDLDSAIASAGSDGVETEADKLYLQQVAHHATYTKWVMFTDLHCAPATLDTCIEILDTVHQLAVDSNAGVLFLGDFWHHRGTLRIDMLNRILDALKDWKVPLVMIPGNHDQVTLGGQNHGLTPLQNAFRVETESGKSFPGPLIFSHPTVFQKALLVPHIRDVGTMESVLQSPHSKQADAIFVHADVTGAQMNDLIISQEGVSPKAFPKGIPIYSGHFHKPHVVRSTGVKIEYVGSPYETSLAEANQDKSLLLLNSTDSWNCIEKVPLLIGKKHYRCSSLEEFLLVDRLRPGDRVVLSIAQDEAEAMRREAKDGEPSVLDNHVAKLRLEQGAVVEVREVKSVPLEPIGDGGYDTRQLEDLTPSMTLASFFSEQAKRGAMTNETAENLLMAGRALLDELEGNIEAPPSKMTTTELDLLSVTLSGFGPFKDEVTYPLSKRGLVLLRGANQDGGSDSNGSGKSSLAMASLWALTGNVDPRPMSDAKVGDVINDESTVARVSVRGALNGLIFNVARSKTATKSALVFSLGDDDLTTQSVKETQEMIDEKLGVSTHLLARTMFHGQHSMNGLLEATDAKFKEELSLLVPLDLWNEAASLARGKGKKASKEAAELKGMITLREGDIQLLEQKSEKAKQKATVQRQEVEDRRRFIEEKKEHFSDESVNPDSLGRIQRQMDEKLEQIRVVEERKTQLLDAREKDIEEAQAFASETTSAATQAKEEYQDTQRGLDRASMMVEVAEENLKRVESKWNVDSSKTEILPPNVCPTCNQPILEGEDHHSHSKLLESLEKEVNDAREKLDSAKSELVAVSDKTEQVKALWQEKQGSMNNRMKTLESVKSYWIMRTSDTEEQLVITRKEHQELSQEFSIVASKLEQASELRALSASLAAEEDLAAAAEEIYEASRLEVEKAQEKLQQYKSSAEEHRLTAKTMGDLAESFGARGVQTFILQNAVESLQSIAQGYLDEMSDGSQRLSLTLDAGDKILRRAYIRSPDGSFAERPMSSLSGGQWRRCSLAVNLGFADLVSRRGRLQPSLVVLDEPLTHLDRSGRTRVGNLLRTMMRRNETSGWLDSTGIQPSTVLLILQDLAAEELEESFDKIDEVTKKEGASFVSIDEKAM